MSELPGLGDVLDLPSGQREEANRYRVRQIIGEGGMGRVLRASDARLGRDVAIKVLTSVDNAERFYREARMLAAFDHPNIVRVIDYSGPNVQSPYLVMELLSGNTLTAQVQKKPLDEAALSALAQQLLKALVHAHANGVIHRDLKPDNVMLEPGGRAVLVDFGLAKGTSHDSARKTFAASATQMLGTPGYASPEQLLENVTLGPRSDLFSLGSTLYFAASGRAPFKAENILDLIDAVRTREPPRLALSGPLARLLPSLMQKEPERRPKDAASALQELAGNARAFDQTQVVEPLGPETPAKRTSPFVFLAPLLALCAVAFVWFTRPVQRPPSPPAAVVPSDAPVSPPVVAQQGVLRIFVKPWGEVSIDGQHVGTTPIFSEARVALGEHIVTVTHPRLGTQSVTVQLSASTTERDVVIELAR